MRVLGVSVVAVALGVVAGCGGSSGGGGFFAAATAPITTSKPAPVTPAPVATRATPVAPVVTATPAPLKSYDGTGTVAVVGTANAVVFTLASGGKKWELQGPKTAELSEKLGLGKADEARGYPIRVRGVESKAATKTAGSTSVQLVEFSLVSGYTTRNLKTGVTWRRATFPALFGSKQNINALEVDPSKPGVGLRLAKTNKTTGERTSAIGIRTGAEAALNASFFEFQRHDPTGFFKLNDQVLFRNNSGRARSTFGLAPQGGPLMTTLAPTDNWPAARHALGAGPGLVTSGKAKVATAEGYGGTFATARHPRSAVGIKPSGEVVLVTVDGRTSFGAGMSLAELARLMVLLGCDKAMNLDGGGSTAMWIKGQGSSGVVNHPSDPGGERAVSTVILADW